MTDWFTIEAIDSSTYAISEYKHWEETHSYLLIGTKSALLIDTGLGVANIKKVVDSLTSLPILVVTTHVHWDHIGGHNLFDNFAVYEAEKDWLAGNFPIPLEVVKGNLTREPCDFPKQFHIEDYHIYQGEPKQILHDGETLDLGNRQVRVVHAAGHSPGHCCFYEPQRKYLYSGDLIYKGCLDAFYPSTNPLLFMRSVEKIKTLNIEKILPAHHQINISVALIDEVAKAFNELYKANKLKQGAGIFDFGDFQIHI